jgi:uncharacterized protein YbbC (DUF1343 family)
LISACGYSNSASTDPVVHDDVPMKQQIIPQLFVGAERTLEFIPQLTGKKVGIVGNQSSRIGDTHLVDSLISLGVDIQRVFSPEHGFRGNADAGAHVASGKDAKTGLPIVSLYGKNKKPTQDQLKGLDVVVFDIQDVGVRFYTYISTLHYVMEACAEAGIPVIVLDRPNPNAHYVDGPVLDPKFASFVGMHPVPVVYGMTIGEYGMMINGEKWLKNNLECNLTVIACKNYSHGRRYALPVPPSPNLRSERSIQLYPSLCLFEATTVSVGRGTDTPFEIYGHPNFSKTDYEFTPSSGYGSKYPKHKEKTCNGYNLHDSLPFRMDKFDLSFLLNANKLLKGKVFVDREGAFNGLAGNATLLKQLRAGLPEEQIRASWQKDLDEFKLVREKYLLYL